MSGGLLADEPVLKDAPVDFVRQVQPMLTAHCGECHGAKRQEGGLRLNRRESALAGGDSGQKAIVPGDVQASRLIKVVDGSDSDLKMPPEGEGTPLGDEQIALIKRWVNEGANWPAGADGPAARPDHWAWKKPTRRPLPPVKQANWPRHPLDTFVLAALEKAGLAPAPEADRHTLVRRVHLDLIGLPPTPEQVDAFVSDAQSDAYERMVDRVLADPAFGERWARVWLDLARYADSKGYGSDPLRTIWRYRDWVIESFNRNMRYDQFTIEQLAGDLLSKATPDQVLATAFHRNTMANDEGGTDDEEFRVAAVKDRIETTMQVWMGLTMGCAKCHSHKFDPITQREYYQGYAFFDQTEDADRGDEEPKMATPTRLEETQMAELRSQIATLQGQISQPPAGLDAQVTAWEQAVAQQSSQWVVLRPEHATAEGETKLEVLPDGSVLSGSEKPERDTFHVSVTTETPGITAFRIEVLPHESLPMHGPGQAGGNFVLNELRVTAQRQPPGPVQGRFVRIEIPGDKQLLSLAEVQVFHGSENTALKGKATQSSTYASAGPELAIDNQTGGDFDKKSVTHTNDEKNPWWEVDLGQSGALERITIWNRTDHGVESRLKHFQLSVLDDQRNPVWQRTIDEAPLPSREFNLSEPTQWELVDPTSDFAQQDWPIEKAIDGNADSQSGWAISPSVGKPHYAVFNTKRPLAFHGPLSLDFTLVQTYGRQHTLGRIRILATTHQPPAAALPERIGEILALAAGARSVGDRVELTNYYWTHSPAAGALRAQMAGLEKQVMDLEKLIAATPIMRELPLEKRRITSTMVKGNFRVPGERVAPAVPAAFHPLLAGVEPTRLALARWLVDRENPLTARVAVNRFWAQLFGQGIVATEEDFGTQGLPPTHPEVLDWLAVEFMDNGWDVKDILRQIVGSATYRQSSSPSAEVLQKDPPNRLLGRGPRFRLEAEMVRDQALAISGLLSPKQGGPSVYPPQPPNMWRAAFNGQRTWSTSTGEDRYRRGLYTYWRRTVPYPSMAAFDAPSREICTMRRISTNTPLQAFVTLNDPVYVEAAQALARRIVGHGGASAAERGAFALRLALSRPPHPAQVDQLVTLYQSELDHYRQDAKAAAEMATEPLGPLPAGYDVAELAAWTVVSNVILNLDGVLTKR